MTRLNLKHLYGKSSQKFSQNSNAYNFSSNENMSLKLHTMTHFDTISLGIQCFYLVEGILNLSKLQGGHL